MRVVSVASTHTGFVTMHVDRELKSGRLDEVELSPMEARRWALQLLKASMLACGENVR